MKTEEVRLIKRGDAYTHQTLISFYQIFSSATRFASSIFWFLQWKLAKWNSLWPIIQQTLWLAILLHCLFINK